MGNDKSTNLSKTTADCPAVNAYNSSSTTAKLIRCWNWLLSCPKLIGVSLKKRTQLLVFGVDLTFRKASTYDPLTVVLHLDSKITSFFRSLYSLTRRAGI